jgi:hypothetical protein
MVTLTETELAQADQAAERQLAATVAALLTIDIEIFQAMQH